MQLPAFGLSSKHLRLILLLSMIYWPRGILKIRWTAKMDFCRAHTSYHSGVSLHELSPLPSYNQGKPRQPTLLGRPVLR